MLADIPGLIEGAHEGAGLGDRFLGHVERCAVLLHLVDGAAGDVVRAWRTVREELAAYGGGLAEKPEIIGLNKADAMTPRETSARMAALAQSLRAAGHLLSGVTGQGVPEVLRALQNTIHATTAGASGVIPSIAAARRIVVKIGSALVVDQKQAAPRTAWLDSVAADIAALRARGTDVIVVSSGAIALARRTLRSDPEAPEAGREAGRRRGRADPAGAGLEPGAVGPRPDRRAIAADAGRHRGPPPLPERPRNAEHAAGAGCIPVINENDTVATAEIRFGDNDRLAARVAEMVQADQLVLLSDIDGLYTADPRRDPAGRAHPGG